MTKYRLTWTGDGSLDLSQILDERGRPVVLTQKGAKAIVSAATYQHPLIRHYEKSGLKGEKLSETPKPIVPSVPLIDKPPQKIKRKYGAHPPSLDETPPPPTEDEKPVEVIVSTTTSDTAPKPKKSRSSKKQRSRDGK